MIFDPLSLQKYRLIYLKLRAVSGSTRFYLLSLINNQTSLNVGQIVEQTNMEQAIVSQHLAVLKKADLVAVAAIKKERFYSINKVEIEKMISLCKHLRKKGEPTEIELKNAYSKILEAYKYFKLLLHPVRLALIEIMDRKGAASVNELAELSGQSQSITSQNLKLLLELDLVTKKEEGRKSIYNLNTEQLRYLHSIVDKYN
jgi:DNA-binding transcriptional ArsR family regulator